MKTGEEEEDLLDLFEGLGLILREVSGLLGDFEQLGKPQLALYELSPIGGENIRRLVDACQHSIREQR